MYGNGGVGVVDDERDQQERDERACAVAVAGGWLRSFPMSGPITELGWITICGSLPGTGVQGLEVYAPRLTRKGYGFQRTMDLHSTIVNH